MVTVKEISDFFNRTVPNSMKMDFDNVGFLAGNGSSTVTRVLVVLDITDDVIEEAKEYGAQLIVSHHPLMFSLKNASTDDMIGRKLVSMLGAGISAICLHTNLDSAVGGVNDRLMEVLGVHNEGIIEVLGAYDDGTAYGMGRYGRIAETDLQSFLSHCKRALECNGLRYVDAGKPVHRVAVCGGSGSSMLEMVAALGCDTYVTADVKHNAFLDAKEMGINLIDGGHYSTENVVIPVVRDMLANEYPELELRISRRHGQPEQYFV